MKFGNIAFAAAAFAAALTGLSASPARADERIVVEHQGVERMATLHRPSALQAVPAPLIVALHGLGQSIEVLHDWLHLDAAADHAGFNVVYPEAIGRKWNYGRPIKDAQPTVNGKTVDDVGFIRSLLDGLVSMKVADPARIYVTGMSRGGLMTYTLVCALSNRIAAAAPLISGMTDRQREDCRPTRPVPMMVIAGTNDESQWYDGIITPAGRLLSIPETMEYWRVKNGCTEETASWLPHRDESIRRGCVSSSGRVAATTRSSSFIASAMAATSCHRSRRLTSKQPSCSACAITTSRQRTRSPIPS